jgi:hypothetical protein
MNHASAREVYRVHRWQLLFHRVEAFRCVQAVEEACRCRRNDDAEVWMRALIEWIRRDSTLSRAHNAHHS